MVELGWDLPPQKLEVMQGAGEGWMDLGVTYGRTSSTRSTIVTTSTLWERRHPLVMPTGRRGGPQTPPCNPQGSYSQQGQMDQDDLSHREDHEDPEQGREDV